VIFAVLPWWADGASSEQCREERRQQQMAKVHDAWPELLSVAIQRPECREKKKTEGPLKPGLKSGKVHHMARTVR